MLARERGTASMRGEFLDAIVDRYNDLIALLGLLYWYRNDPLPAALAAAALVGSTLVSYTRAKGEACGVDTPGGFMQRHERAVYLGVFTLLSPLVATWVEPGAAHPRFHLTIAMLAVVAVATNVTAVLRARHVLERMR
jgi:CDP-diacylglycerol--glycerol-3-phosphate 3-phosphatidyltransferase